MKINLTLTDFRYKKHSKTATSFYQSSEIEHQESKIENNCLRSDNSLSAI